MIKKIFFLHIVYTYKPWSYPSITEQARVCLGCWRRAEIPAGSTALSLIDGRETRHRLVHASIARGITASFVSGKMPYCAQLDSFA